MTGEPTDQRFELVLAPNSPAVRLLVELSGFANADLLPAKQALEVAAKWQGAGNSTEAGWLVDFAVVSYCRAFMHSAVRKRLDDYITIPESLFGLHETVRAYRNTTVAHSQSELLTTWPVVSIDHEHAGVRELLITTIGQPLPWGLVVKFANLVDAILELVDERTDEVRPRVEAEVQRATGMGFLPPGSGITRAAMSEFDPRTKRQPFPTRQTLYWSIEEPDATAPALRTEETEREQNSPAELGERRQIMGRRDHDEVEEGYEEMQRVEGEETLPGPSRADQDGRNAARRAASSWGAPWITSDDER